MNPEDIKLLKYMQERVTPFRDGRKPPIGEADRLVNLRDMLQFEDKLWYHELTQHLATLDSASTFTPKNEEESKHTISVVKTAAHQILELIDEKLPDTAEPK